MPYTLCASYYTGAVRLAMASGCNTGELTLDAPDDLPFYLCVNPTPPDSATAPLRPVAGATSSSESSTFLRGCRVDDAFDSLGSGKR
ncbi:MAG: hypothetical protein R2849_07170 [Thermomicrobiales bacterium]